MLRGLSPPYPSTEVAIRTAMPEPVIAPLDGALDLRLEGAGRGPTADEDLFWPNPWNATAYWKPRLAILCRRGNSPDEYRSR